MPAIIETTVENSARAEYVKYLNFGSGNFSLIGETIYRDCHKLFGYAPANANGIAHFVMRELGAIFSNKQFKVADVKLGKVNKDGKVNLKFAAQTAKAVTHGDAQKILSLVQWLNPDNDLGIDQSSIRCNLSPAMQEVLDKHSKPCGE